jgi:hypothetical protein
MRTTAEPAPYLGPCVCPECGYDDGGELRVVDVYEELCPPIPYRLILAVWGDDPEQHGSLGVQFCPVCDEEFDPTTMRPRLPVAS